MRILVIDDDQDTCDVLSMTLGAQGYAVDCVQTSEEGLQFLNRTQPDLLILDVMLPHTLGWDVCQQIRTFSDIPILMISAFARTVDDMVHGLESGADDYLAKPVNLGLLKAQVRALLRRCAHPDRRNVHPVYVDPYLTIDLQHQQVHVQGHPVILSLMEWELLELLVRNANNTVPTLEIVEHLWRGTPNEDSDTIDYVHTYVGRLRRKIEPNSRHPLYIVNEYGLGYSFVKQV